MNSFALTLILFSAFIHAFWNLLLKRIGGGAAVIWLYSGIAAILYAPAMIVFIVLTQPTLGLIQFVFITGTGILHLLYFLLLQRAYSVGDLSLVYPLARGTGPTLSTLAAIGILGDRPTATALFGFVLVVGGTVLLTFTPKTGRASNTRVAITYGLLTGVCIATYSVWDTYAVTEIAVPPLVLQISTEGFVALMLTPLALRNWDQVKSAWTGHRGKLIGIGICQPASYLLILTALTFTNLSYVAPAREISILIGAVMGSRFLGEEHSTRRIVAAVLMVAGVVALAAG